MITKLWSRSVTVSVLAAVLVGCGAHPGSVVSSSLFKAATAAKADAFSQSRAVVKIHFADHAQLETLEHAGIDLFENVNNHSKTVGATITSTTEATLKQLGIRYEVERTPQALTATGLPTGYQTVDQVYADMNALAQSHANVARVVEIGKSLEGRPLLAMNITSKPGQGLPAVRFNSGQHARELPPVELTSRLMHQLVEGYGQDAHTTALLDTRDVWIVPIVNPDGRTKVQGGSSMWRKNTRKLSNGNYGVDTNRNCDDHFSGGDDSQGADDYHGPKPFSEPESSAMRDLCAKVRFKASLDLHNFAGMVLWPPGYTDSFSKDEATFKKIGGQMADHLDYQAGTIATTIYKTWGDLSTWEYDTYGTLAFAAELNDSGFSAGINEMQKDWKDWSPNFLYLIDAAANPDAKRVNAPPAINFAGL